MPKPTLQDRVNEFARAFKIEDPNNSHYQNLEYRLKILISLSGRRAIKGRTWRWKLFLSGFLIEANMHEFDRWPRKGGPNLELIEKVLRLRGYKILPPPSKLHIDSAMRIHRLLPTAKSTKEIHLLPSGQHLRHIASEGCLCKPVKSHHPSGTRNGKPSTKEAIAEVMFVHNILIDDESP